MGKEAKSTIVTHSTIRVNKAGALLLNAIVECVSFYFKVFITSAAFSSVVRVITVNAALVLLIELV